MRRFLLLLFATALAPLPAAAQAPITLLVGYVAGGAVDAVARQIAEPLRKELGRPVVIENRPGAAGIIAATELKRATPDGSVMLLAPLVIPVLAPMTYRELPYDPNRDLAPVSQVLRLQQALAVPASHPARTLAEFVGWAKANPSRASFGSSTPGGLPHFMGLLLNQEAGIDMVFAAYKGSAPMLNDLAGGQIAAGIDALADLLPLHRGGRIRILASSGSARSPLAPDVPTFAEQGYPSITVVSWMALFAPAGTPKDVRDRIARVIGSAVQSPEIREAMISRGFEPTGTTPDALAAIVAADRARWEPIVKASGFRAD